MKTPAPAVSRLLKIETAITLPTFILAWFGSAFLFAARAGWLCASASGDKKREVLEAMFGKGDE